ncbi:uncharacterized protein LOC117242687 [Bombus vosnesenskii]|uniref:Uncharacterized protein LOC117242687 n=1 Tax=Bombus vosnesenskii TaxID=207650 RepID=A0A6J3LJA0_9HYME|nr:uncharacterized protein LOC117242687 [Bombus vosnesenskii]
MIRTTLKNVLRFEIRNKVDYYTCWFIKETSDKIVIVGVYHFDCHAKITRFAQDAIGVFLLFKAYNGKIIINRWCKTTFFPNGPFILLVITGDHRGVLVTVDSDIL